MTIPAASTSSSNIASNNNSAKEAPMRTLNAHSNIAFDLDDTTISTGKAILTIIRQYGYDVSDEREPYAALRTLLTTEKISQQVFDAIFNSACDWAQPIMSTITLIKLMIQMYGEAHIVSTRSYINEKNVRMNLSRVMTAEEVSKINFHWCKAPSEVITKAVEEQGMGDAKLATFKYLAENVGVNAFMDDLMFNIKTLIDNVPEITPILVHQPWVADKRYLPELMDHKSIIHYYL